MKLNPAAPGRRWMRLIVAVAKSCKGRRLPRSKRLVVEHYQRLFEGAVAMRRAQFRACLTSNNPDSLGA